MSTETGSRQIVDIEQEPWKVFGVYGFSTLGMARLESETMDLKPFRTTEPGDYERGANEIVETLSKDHNLKDAKGRTITGEAVISSSTHAAWTTLRIGPGLVEYFPETREYTIVPNYGPHLHHFSVRLVSMRDGQGFGAYARSTYYSTLEEAREAALKGLDAQAKRYQKLFGKGA